MHQLYTRATDQYGRSYRYVQADRDVRLGEIVMMGRAALGFAVGPMRRREYGWVQMDGTVTMRVKEPWERSEHPQWRSTPQAASQDQDALMNAMRRVYNQCSRGGKLAPPENIIAID